MKSIKVLAIDGGGIRGIIFAVILSEFLQLLAKEYVESSSDTLTKICQQLQEGRGGDAPGIGRRPA